MNAVDCWDGDDGEPLIYHGHTLTTRILFKDVVTACKKYAFEKSDFPLIFSIENHCSVEQQVCDLLKKVYDLVCDFKDAMADYLINILGDMLYQHTINDDEEHVMPSPMDLRKKVLIKAKRLPQDATSNDDIDIHEEDNDEVDEANKKHAKKLSKKLSDLVNYIHAVHFPGFEEGRGKFYHMSSFGESKTKAIFDDPERNTQFVNYNMKQISR